MDVSPWPGKCLTHAATPASCSPATHAADCRATGAAWAPNARTPITGLIGLLFTSATGARSRSMPAAARSAPAAEPGGGPPQDPVGGFCAGEARQQAAVGEAFDGVHGQPLTAPAVSPPATCRWTRRKKTTTGRAVRVAPAMSPPQSVPCWVVNDASQMVSVCFDELLRRT